MSIKPIIVEVIVERLVARLAAVPVVVVEAAVVETKNTTPTVCL